MINSQLFSIAKNTVELLKKHNLKLSTAESCTGGMVSSYITAVSGVSEIFELGLTTYSCNAKHKALGVKADTLEKYGAISEQTVIEMAEGVKRLASSELGAAVSGVAGPDSSEGHPAGYVYIAVSGDFGTVAKLLNIEPESRNYIRETAVASLFELIEVYIKENYQ